MVTPFQNLHVSDEVELNAFVDAAEGALSDAEPIVVRWPNALPGGRNWGDRVNPALVRALSGRDVINAEDPDAPRHGPIHFVIGSGLASAGENALVWGSGFIRSDQELRRPVGRIHAVRGPLSRQKVVGQGGSPILPLGDPALLLPLIYSPVGEPQYDIGIIQHFREVGFEPLPQLPSGLTNRIIDITGGLRRVVDEILSCRHILSSSLHGLIVSHAYGIPATWLKISDRPLGDDFKFRDYWASIGRHEMAPVDIRENPIVDPSTVISAPADVQVDLVALLRACPFISEGRKTALISVARSGGRQEWQGEAVHQRMVLGSAFRAALDQFPHNAGDSD